MLEDENRKPKVGICIPTIVKPYDACIQSLVKAAPVLEEQGWPTGLCFEFGNAYISVARAVLMRKALNAYADVIVFIDHDVAFEPDALIKLLETEGDYVAGTYRYKNDTVKYMGFCALGEHEGKACIEMRADGAFKASHVPAGFLKITKNAINKFMLAHPELVWGEPCNPHIDFFNHGAIDGIWYGEDFASSKRWTELGGEIWLVPDLDLTHHSKYPDTGEPVAYPGNYWRYVREKNFMIRSIPS